MARDLRVMIEEMGSPYDLAEEVEEHFPANRKGYILARIALAEDMWGFRDYAKRALVELDRSNQAGILEPPLNDTLAPCVNLLARNVVDGSLGIDSPVTRVILAWAIDGSERI